MVALIKHTGTQVGAVQEEATAEVIDLLVGLRHKLVGEERHFVACLAEYFRKERCIAPVAFIANGVQREKVLKSKAGKVPAGHHIRERDEGAVLCPLQLTGGRRLVVAIELGVVFVVALANNQDNVWCAEGATVHLNLFTVFQYLT